MAELSQHGRIVCRPLDEANRKRDEAKKMKEAAEEAARAIATQKDWLKNNFKSIFFSCTERECKVHQ